LGRKRISVLSGPLLHATHHYDRQQLPTDNGVGPANEAAVLAQVPDGAFRRVQHFSENIPSEKILKFLTHADIFVVFLLI
jgi:hypothetical protein